MALVLSEQAIADVADLYGDGSLLLGGEPLSRKEWDVLFDKWKVRHVVRCVASEVETEMGLDKSTRGSGFRLLHLKLHDIVGFDIKKYFQQSAEFIDEALPSSSSRAPTQMNEGVERGPIFVHCQAGVSRSVTIILSFLLLKRGKSIKDGLQFIRGTRAMARPNVSFLSQLSDLEREVFINSLPSDADDGVEVQKKQIADFRPSIDVGEYVIDAALVRWGAICPKSVIQDLYYSPECLQNAQKLNLMISAWYEETENCRAVLSKVRGEKPKQQEVKSTTTTSNADERSLVRSRTSEKTKKEKLFATVDPEIEEVRVIWRELNGAFDEIVTRVREGRK